MMNGDNSLKTILVLILLTVFASILFGSCATSRVPASEELGESRAAINQAEQVGAGDYAPLELRAARKKLEMAQQLNDDEEYAEAKRFAERALVDAELAEIKALSANAQKAVRELEESIRTLKEEIERKQNNS